MQEIEVFWGVDVAKAELVIASSTAPRTTQTIKNDATAIMAWLNQVEPGGIVAMESTGKYHQLLAQLAFAAGWRVYVLNSADVYFYAKALGSRGKTDKVDAGVITRYVAEHHKHLHPWQPYTATEQSLWSLLERRAEVTKHRGALRQSLTDMPELAKAAGDLEKQFELLLQTIDQQVEGLIASDALLSKQRALLQTVPGIGAQCSALLGVLFSRMTFANADAVVAYSGLDPRPCDSGNKKGRRRISKRGSAYLRRMLYLVAFAATRSKAMKATYEGIKAKGFAPTQALVILARKLLRIAFSIWKSGRPFETAPAA